MRKVLSFIIVFVVLLFPFAFIPVSSFAYVSSSNLYTRQTFTSFKCSAESDGIFLFHTIYKSYYDPSIVNTPEKLNHINFTGDGVWQGKSLSELSSNYLFDQDVTGFSQVMSYSDEEEYFVYSVMTCLPVLAGDTFELAFNYNSSYVVSQTKYRYLSFIPGGTGISLVYRTNGNSHLTDPLSYTIQSSNQHLAVFVNSDKYSSSASGIYRLSSACLCPSFSGLSFVCNLDRAYDVFTTPYGLSSGSEISVTMEDSCDNYSFAVYEIFTNGTTNPGLDTGERPTTSPPVTTSGSSGGSSGSGGNFDFSEVIKRLIEIRQSIDDKVIEITVDFSSAVLDKLDEILISIKELPLNMWECFKIGLADMFDIDISDEPEQPPNESDDSSSDSEKDDSISLEIDQDSFDSAIENVDSSKLSSGVSGSGGAIAFFWYFTNRFFTTMNLYTLIAIVLFLSFLTWILRS